MKSVVLIEAPSNLGLMPPAPGQVPGVGRAPAVLRDLGLTGGVRPVETVVVRPGPYRPDRDGVQGIRNVDGIRDFSIRLADVVERVVRSGHFPLVIGGDCSILLGSALGLRRIGTPALLFLDGHTDFQLPEQSGTGGAAGLDLALVTGWGPSVLVDIEGRGPSVRPERVALIGNRDFDPRPRGDIPDPASTGMFYRDLVALRGEGGARTIRSALSAIDPGADGYWIHLDVDVLDSIAMPAVDSPQPDGLSWAELDELLTVALSGNASGLQVTIYDPDRDPGLRSGKRLVGMLSAVLASSLGEGTRDGAPGP